MSRLIREIAALAAAFLAACAILIPTADYVRWDDGIGLCFVVLLLYGFIRELIPQIKEFFLSRKMLLLFIGVLLVTGCVFFGKKRPHVFTGETNLVTIYPGDFTVSGLALTNHTAKPLPCVGYIVGGGSTWEIRPQQELSPVGGAEPLTLELSTYFIRKNRIGLLVSFYQPGILQYRINGDKMEFSAPEAGKYQIPLNSPTLRAARHRFSAERIVLFSGISVLLLLAAVFAQRICKKIVRGESVSWDLMLAVCILFAIYIIPILRYETNCPDLSASEPNMPLPRDYKHPPLIAVCWRVLHLLIPAKSVFISFAVGLLLLYLGGLLMTERFLCKLREKWPAWSIFLFVLNMWRFYQNVVLVDELFFAAAFFVLGLLALLLNPKRKQVLFSMLILFLPLTVMVMKLRHEAAGVAFVFCVALAGVFINQPSSRRRFRKIAFSIAGGMLLFAAVFGIYRGLVKYVCPVKDDSVSDVIDSEFRRYQLKEILKICYYGRHYDWLPKDFSKCLPEEFTAGGPPPFRLGGKVMTRFKLVSSNRIESVWKTMIRQHPFIYLKSKFEGFYAICKQLDRYQNFWQNPDFCYGFFSPHLPSRLCCGSLLLTLLVSGVLLLRRPIFHGVLYFAAITSAAGTAHMAALFLIPVSPQARYLYWVYLSGGISFVLLLYIVWLLIRSRLGRASIRRLYINR